MGVVVAPLVIVLVGTHSPKKRINLKKMNGTWHSIEKKPKVFGFRVDHAQAVGQNNDHRRKNCLCCCSILCYTVAYIVDSPHGNSKISGQRMNKNPIMLLADTIDSLWLWTYGIIAGWGLTVTVVIVAIVLLLIRTINLQRRVDKLENRLVHAERDYNLTISNWKNR